jgi:hypothetical protein
MIGEDVHGWNGNILAFGSIGPESRRILKSI